jgi:hypothetical protein
LELQATWEKIKVSPNAIIIKSITKKKALIKKATHWWENTKTIRFSWISERKILAKDRLKQTKGSWIKNNIWFKT